MDNKPFNPFEPQPAPQTPPQPAPAQPMQPVQPTQPAQPMQPPQAAQPVQTVQPVQPGQPVASALDPAAAPAQAAPAQPIDPMVGAPMAATTATVTDKKSNRNLITIIALVVVLALIGGVLAWYFLMNAPQPAKKAVTASDATSNNATAPAPAAPTTKDTCLTTEKLCFTHPSDWTTKYTPASGDMSPYESLTIDSPDKKTQILANSGQIQLGGACQDAANTFWKVTQYWEVGTMKQGAFDKAMYPNSDTKVYATMGYKKDTDGTFAPVVGMSNYKKAGELATHKLCDSGFFDVLAKVNGKGYNMVKVVPDVSLKSYKTEAEMTAALKSDNMTKAFDILKTAAHK